MNNPKLTDQPLDPRLERRLLDVLIRAGLILALVMVCYRVFSPFLVLMVWALILAVTLYPLHQWLARRMGGQQGWAATLITVLGVALIVVPDGRAAGFDGRFGAPPDRRRAAEHAGDPAAQAGRRRMAGGRAEDPCRLATGARRPARAGQEPCSRSSVNLAKAAVAMVAGIGAGILEFVAAFIIAGIIMAFGKGGDRASHAIFDAHRRRRTRRRVHHAVGGDDPCGRPGRDRHRLHPGHPRRLCLLVAGVPLAGVLAVIVLVLGIAQVPALIVTLPAIAYIWMSGDYGTGEAVSTRCCCSSPAWPTTCSSR